MFQIFIRTKKHICILIHWWDIEELVMAPVCKWQKTSYMSISWAVPGLPYQRLFRTHRGLGSNPQCISLILCRFINWWETLCAYLFPLSGVIWVPCWKLLDCFLVPRDPGLPRLVLCPVLKRKFGPLLLLLSHTGHTKLVQCTFDRMPNFGWDHSHNLALWKKERLSIYWLRES